MTKATCRIVRLLAPSAETADPSGRLESHVNTCLSCQAEMARYAKLRRQLMALSGEVEKAPDRLAAVMAQMIEHDEATVATSGLRSRPATVAAAGGAVIAAAAGAVAVAVWRHSRATV